MSTELKPSNSVTRQPRLTPHVVIVGGGFAGLETAKALKAAPVRVTVIDKTNHHLFQPLLYQVATAGLSPAQIAAPIRHVLSKQKNCEVLMGEVVAIDAKERRVTLADGELTYDYLVLAAGARHSYFGNPTWEHHAPGLKTLDDALELRRRMLGAFEAAERTSDPGERAKAMTFVVVGAGPTGVEMAGAIAEVARFTLVKDFRRINPRDARIVLVEAGPRVLPMYTKGLSESALQQLEDIGVEVRLNTMVKDLTADAVQLGDETVPARTVVWAAGNAASPLTRNLGAELDKAGRVVVTEHLTVPGSANTFAIGDLAHFGDATGKPLPGVSPVAIQQGNHAARNIRRAIVGKPLLPFKYFDKGSMATIGRHAAVADVMGLRFSGFPAWLAWLFVHLIFLVGFRNRLMVLVDWAWSYLSYQKGARLITKAAVSTGDEGTRAELARAA